MVTIRTTSLTFNNYTFCPHSVFMCFVWISAKQPLLYNINWLVFITETECVYCAVRTGYLNTLQVNLCLWRCSANHFLRSSASGHSVSPSRHVTTCLCHRTHTIFWPILTVAVSCHSSPCSISLSVTSAKYLQFRLESNVRRMWLQIRAPPISGETGGGHRAPSMCSKSSFGVRITLTESRNVEKKKA